jgi:hypothetical protein
MVKARWKFERGKVYLELDVLNKLVYYWFPKSSIHKRFHPRQIFTRNIMHKAYRDSNIPRYVSAKGWIEGELDDSLVWDKLGLANWSIYYDALAKAC